ncbi:MAG: hypothetical protein ACOY3V_07525 [Pseudomonadota bacterium]
MIKTLAKYILPMALALGANTAAADELGRLFFTPQQRVQLEREQLHPPQGGTQSALIVNGIVQKHGGKRVAWINGVQQVVGDSDAQTPATVPLDIAGQTRPVKVKVGQKIFIQPGESE